MIGSLEVHPSFIGMDSTVCMMSKQHHFTQPLHACHAMHIHSSSQDAKPDFASVVSNDMDGDDEAMLLQLPKNELLTSDSEDETSMDLSESSNWSGSSVQESRPPQEKVNPCVLLPQAMALHADANYHQQLLKRFQESMQQTDHSRYMIRQSLQDTRGQYPVSEAFFLHQRCLELEASRYAPRKWVERELKKQENIW